MCELGRYPLIAELDQAQILLLKDQIGEKRGEATRVHAILKAYEWSTCFRSVCSKHNQSTLQVETAKREKETLEQKMKDQLSEICLTKNSAGMYVPLQTQHCIVHFQGLRHPRSKRTHCGAILAGPERRERPEARRVSSSQEVGFRCLRNFHASELLGFVRKRGYRDTSKLPCELGT
jgi:hypothetical protein